MFKNPIGPYRVSIGQFSTFSKIIISERKPDRVRMNKIEIVGIHEIYKIKKISCKNIHPFKSYDENKNFP